MCAYQSPLHRRWVRTRCQTRAVERSSTATPPVAARASTSSNAKKAGRASSSRGSPRRPRSTPDLRPVTTEPVPSQTWATHDGTANLNSRDNRECTMNGDVVFVGQMAPRGGDEIIIMPCCGRCKGRRVVVVNLKWTTYEDGWIGIGCGWTECCGPAATCGWWWRSPSGIRFNNAPVMWNGFRGMI